MLIQNLNFILAYNIASYHNGIIKYIKKGTNNIM